MECLQMQPFRKLSGIVADNYSFSSLGFFSQYWKVQLNATKSSSKEKVLTYDKKTLKYYLYSSLTKKDRAVYHGEKANMLLMEEKNMFEPKINELKA